MRPPVTLTIAGNDGSGGAGIQADLKTFSALGCYGVTVLTALAIQNTQGVKKIYPIPSENVREQIHVLMEDIEIDAIKIGMLHRTEIIEVVADAFKSYPSPIVLDPVMIAKGGHVLMGQEALTILKDKLLPLVTLITPNLCEASSLLGREIGTQQEMEEGARELLDLGAKAVLIKGGHLKSHECADCLCTSSDQPVQWFRYPRIVTKNTHGTGCTFSSAITAFLAQGITLEESVRRAKNYISRCIEAAHKLQIGRGNGPVHHFYQQKKEIPR